MPCSPPTWGQARQALRRVVQTTAYNTVVLLLIIANSVLLLFQSSGETAANTHVFLLLEWAFLVFFTLEIVLGVLAYGPYKAPDGYLRSGWVLLDVVVVVAGWVTVLTPAGTSVTGLRAFRVLRPLRSMSRVNSVKVMVNTVVATLPAVAHVFLLLLAFWYLLALMGLQLWAGVLHRRCYAPVANTTLYVLQPDQPWACTPDGAGRRCPAGTVCLDRATLLSPLSPEACAPGQAVCPHTETDPGYDHIGQSLIVCMQFLSADAWGALMLRVQSGWADWAWVYFVVMMAVSIIITNLFVGVFYTQIARMTEKARVQDRDRGTGGGDPVDPMHPGLETDSVGTVEGEEGSEAHAVEPHEVFDEGEMSPRLPAPRISADPNSAAMVVGSVRDGPAAHAPTRYQRLRGRLRRALRHIILRSLFITAIFVNLIVLAFDHYEAPEEVHQLIHITNTVCLAVFLLEIALKWCAFGLRQYFRVPFNILDFLLILISCLEFAIAQTSAVSGQRSLVAIQRVMRLLLIGRLAHNIRAVAVLLGALGYAFKGALVTFFLLCLMVCPSPPSILWQPSFFRD